MSITRVPRTAQDIRPSRSVPARAGRDSEQASYARLSQLAKEKHHLLGEQEVWQRKLERITKRLGEIDEQMNALRKQVIAFRGELGEHLPGGVAREVRY
jgi:septal ring factor EnvC (AmiA/AmiB activator)